MVNDKLEMKREATIMVSEEEVELRQCLLPFRSDLLSPPLLPKNVKIII
jgi:hypothetical protein